MFYQTQINIPYIPAKKQILLFLAEQIPFIPGGANLRQKYFLLVRQNYLFLLVHMNLQGNYFWWSKSVKI